jgi:hypothetical protein
VLLALDFEFGALESAFEDAFKKLPIIGSILVSLSVSPMLFIVGLYQMYEDNKCKFFKQKEVRWDGLRAALAMHCHPCPPSNFLFNSIYLPSSHVSDQFEGVRGVGRILVEFFRINKRVSH